MVLEVRQKKYWPHGRRAANTDGEKPYPLSVGLWSGAPLAVHGVDRHKGPASRARAQRRTACMHMCRFERKDPYAT